MLKKTIIGLLIIVLLVSMMILPVSAATFNYNDYIVETAVEGENDILSVSFPTELNRWILADQHDSAHAMKSYEGVDTAWLNTDWFSGCPNDMFIMVYRPLGNHVLRVDNIPSGSTLTVNFVIDVSTTIADMCFITPLYRILYYDAEGNFLGRSDGIYSDEGIVGGDYSGGVALGNYGTVTFDGSTTISKPDGAVYARFWFYMYADPLKEPEGNKYYFTVRKGGTFTFSISSLYRLQQSTGQTNELLGDISENIEELPGEIGDVLENQANAEKEQASQEGDSNVGAIVDVIPNESAGFMNAIQGFASAMSYGGTDAKLKIPALTIPAISGLIPETVLWDGMDLDFGQYIAMLPEGLLTLVRSLLTIALIVYCFKELYDTIAYVMTLRKGAGE